MIPFYFKGPLEIIKLYSSFTMLSLSLRKQVVLGIEHILSYVSQCIVSYRTYLSVSYRTYLKLWWTTPPVLRQNPNYSLHFKFNTLMGGFAVFTITLWKTICMEWFKFTVHHRCYFPELSVIIYCFVNLGNCYTKVVERKTSP